MPPEVNPAQSSGPIEHESIVVDERDHEALHTHLQTATDALKEVVRRADGGRLVHEWIVQPARDALKVVDTDG